MFDALKRWRRRRVLGRSALPDGLWAEAVEALPFVQELDDAERARLRDLVVLFLDTKSIVGAGGHEVTPLQRVVIAIQACVLVLELSLDWYADFENVVVYPDEFVPGWTWEDEAGVVHASDGPLAGEAMPGGPVALSWRDVEASADFEATGMNLVIHEFAHERQRRHRLVPQPVGQRRAPEHAPTAPALQRVEHGVATSLRPHRCRDRRSPARRRSRPRLHR